MPSELDRRFDDMLARVIGPGGRLIIGEDELGRAIVTNFPATLPSLFRTFCALNADSEAIVAGEERLSFADLDRWSEQLAKALASRGIAKGDRVGIAMRNCPSWVVSYMAILKAGAVATLLNGWWQPHEMGHALELVEPEVNRIVASSSGATSGSSASVAPSSKGASACSRSCSMGRLTSSQPPQTPSILFARGASARISFGCTSSSAWRISCGCHQPLSSVATAPAFRIAM